MSKSDKLIDYDWFHWKSDEFLMLSVSLTMRRKIFRQQETRETRALSLHVPSKKIAWLGSPKNEKGVKTTATGDNIKRKGNGGFNSVNERIVDMLLHEPHHVLLQMDFKLSGAPALYRADIRDGTYRRHTASKRNVQNWYTDLNSKVRLGYGHNVRSGKRRAYYKKTDGRWLDLTKVDWADHYSIYEFADNKSTVFVMGDNKHGMSSLYKLNIETGEILEEIYSSEHNDLDGMYQDPSTAKVAGVLYADDFVNVKYLNKDLAKIQRGLQKAIPGQTIHIASKARDAEKYMILAQSDQNPGDYYVYDRKAKKLDWFMRKRAAINPEQMAATQRVDIPVSDGSTIPGYLTLPTNSEGKKLPTIILPHGGPNGVRDTAHWDYEAQFYASRGYAVLKPNFRGSSGYGTAFYVKGLKQWGGLMQDDLTDATNWLIETGVANKKEICIVGSSYGGYAALMGVIKEPKLYKCAVSINGVSNIPAMKKHDSGYIGTNEWLRNMGLEDVSDKEVSPFHRALDINVPVLLIAAKDDARVPYKQSRNMHKKLKKLKKHVQYLELETGTHDMVTAKSRLESLKATERFLAKHIGQ
jgi:prolyl oligopeptidase PreP (S9A serine peptidase family)